MSIPKLSNVYDDIDMLDEVDLSVEITTSSFCNSNKHKYVSPLERKNLKRTLLSSDENVQCVSTVTKGRKSIKRARRNSKIIKRNTNGLKSITKSRKSTSLYKSPVAFVNKPGINDSTNVDNEETDAKYKNNKFFKSRPSEIRRDSISWKSFNLCDTKTFNNSAKKKQSLNTKRSRPAFAIIDNEQVSNKKNLTSRIIDNENGCDITDLSISEGYASLPEESFVTTTTVSDVSQSSENNILTKSSSNATKITHSHKVPSSISNVESQVLRKKGRSTNIHHQSVTQLLSVQDILKDLEETFDQIEPPTSDYSCSDRTLDEQISNGPSFEIEKNSKSRKQLYPIFYQKENKRNGGKMEKKEKQKSRSICKTSFTAENKQMMIDAGQKDFGAKECPNCGMVYEAGSEIDKSLHEKFHEMFITNLKFPGWKKERVVGNYYDGRIIIITKDDLNFKVRKIEEVLKIVDRDLGFPDAGFPQRPNATFLLFISNKTVIGCIVAESITSARKVVLDTSANITPCTPGEEDGKKSDSWCSSTKTVKALCGVNRLWVAREYRRRKIASRLLDCLRCNFIYGYNVPTNQIAFSDPSAVGQSFASAYAKTNNFLVYNMKELVNSSM